MRTTMTLDDDIVVKLREYVQRTGKSAKRACNDLLRMALSQTVQTLPPRRFKLKTFRGKKGLMAGFSWEMSAAELLDKLDETQWKKS